VIEAPEVREDNWEELLTTREAAHVLGMEVEALRKLEAKVRGTDAEIPVLRKTLTKFEAEMLGSPGKKAVLYPLPETLHKWQEEHQKPQGEVAVEAEGPAKVAPMALSDIELSDGQKRNLGVLSFALGCEGPEVFTKILDANPKAIAGFVLSAGGGDVVQLPLPPIVRQQIDVACEFQEMSRAEWIMLQLRSHPSSGIVWTQ